MLIFLIASRVIAFAGFLLITLCPLTAYALPLSAFETDTDRLIAGADFQLKLDTAVAVKNPELIGIHIQATCNGEGSNDPKSSNIRDYKWRMIDGDSYLVIGMPESTKLIKDLGANLSTVCLVLTYEVNGNRIEDPFDLVVPNKAFAYLIAFGFLGAFFLLLDRLNTQPFKPMHGFKEDKCKEIWEQNNNRFQRALKFPLVFAITPMGTYSISLTQALIWTYLTVFMSVYIYWLYGSLLDLTPQILTMLGIGGGTAVASKINALSRSYSIPDRYLGLISRSRVPRLSDLISTSQRPNLFKFQILAFTLIAGGFVLLETMQTFRIPEIPESLVTLMGLSSVVYLGNEVTAESLWSRVQALQKEIEAYAKDNKLEIATVNDVEEIGTRKPALIEELKVALETLYS